MEEQIIEEDYQGQNISIKSDDDSFNSQSRSQQSSNSYPNSQPSTEPQIIDRVPPLQSEVRSIPVPSQNILPREDYRDYRGRREFQYEQSGALIMNSHNLKLLCIKDGLYQFPEMNNKLYLHFKCIEKISGLSEYINVKTLYLENNVIKKIQGLEKLPYLENLFLQNNMITQISGLQHNTELKVINLSYNNLFKIQNIAHLRLLQNLTISNNYLKQFQSLQHLGECSQQLTSIDLSHNQIVGDVNMLNLIPQIKLLTLSGNPFCREVEHYRRIVIGTLKNLLYLDQRAVSEEERMISEKYCQSGKEGVKQLKKILDQKKLKQKMQRKEQIMKDINVHRQRKLKNFKNEIKLLEGQVQDLRKLLEDESNQDMWYYYQTKIDQKVKKVDEFNDHINNITNRIEGKIPQKKITKEQNKQISDEIIQIQTEQNLSKSQEQTHIKTNAQINQNEAMDKQTAKQVIQENQHYESPFHKKHSSLFIQTKMGDQSSKEAQTEQIDKQRINSPTNSMKRENHKFCWGTSSSIQTTSEKKEQETTQLKINTRMGAKKFDYDELD